MTLHDRISTPDGLVGVAEEWWGVAVPSLLADRLAAAARRHRNRWDVAAGPVCWLKSRLLEHGLLGGCGMRCDEQGHTTAVLHVFFLTLAEESWMIERLKNEQQEGSQVARSRLASELRRIEVTPIDATAAKVGGQR